MADDDQLDAIFHAKLEGISDEAIMKQYSVGIREIEKAVLRNTGTNLNLFKSTNRLTNLSPNSFDIETATVWSFKNRGKWATHNGNYRGNWSPYIPRNIILRYSSPGDLILDQFCGGGTTAVEAKLLGRRCIARDLNPAAVELTKQNLDFEMDVNQDLTELSHIPRYYEPRAEVGDALNLQNITQNSIDLICTHPPYANIINYTSGIRGDISFHDTDLFIGDMRIAAKECYRVLKPGGICAVLIGDTRKKKHVIPIGFRTIEVFLSQGFGLKDLVIKRQHNCRTNGFWYSSSIKYNFLLLAHEYLPVFFKPEYIKSKTDFSASAEMQYSIKDMIVSSKPDSLECKTTWVFPKERFDKLVDLNIINRYAKAGSSLLIEGIGEGTDSTHSKSKDCNLLYCKFLYNSNSISSGYKNQAESILKETSPLVVNGGHLIIRTKDFKIDGHTISPVIELWRLPESSFKICEIIVLAQDSELREEPSPDNLEITHEYLLVYRKTS